MRRKGKSAQHPQSRTCFRNNTLKRCNNSGEADNVVLIDLDSNTLDNVKVIGISSGLKKKVRGSSVICIDDDESCPGVGEDNGSEFSDSSSGLFPSSLNHSKISVDADECQFVEEIFSPFKLSKCKRTYSGKASGRNRYGLDSESDNSDSSDNDLHDCEFMETSFGKLREDWEKAYMKRKNDRHNGMHARCDEASTTGLHTGPQKNVEVENPIDEHTEAHVSSSSGTVRCEKESPFRFAQTVEGNSGGASESSKKTPSVDFGWKSTHGTQFSNNKGNKWEGGEEETNTQNEHGGPSLIDEEDQCCKGPSLGSSHEQGNEQVNYRKIFSHHEERTSATKPSNPEPTNDTSFGHTESSFNSHVLNESEVTCSIYGDKDKSSFQNIETCHEMRVNNGVSYSEVGAIPKETLYEVPSLSGIDKEKGACQDTVKQVPKEPSLCSISRNEVHTEPVMGSSSSIGSGEISSPQQEEKDVPFHSQEGNSTEAFISVINEREKLKETDEYKRAVEEEWASRQRELQLQAEEAQKLRLLRKRMNAESMRLLDMERRQKQRVEEVRETRRKDEENMNMKEKLRAEVRKKLKILEIKCPDMASLLRGLGVQLGGGFKPLPQEVRAAYKRALLNFHPDRASGSDIRELVEAEEKFKLISRMKDKLLVT